ncbi:carboxypeptidase-like regulatory domain-containing protein [Pedobacter sp. P351]|uniref:carboxypeptidase-like regulatory domain-containing protein n=1 Tax=Pedobacter superstes TaxID=3133441 RepID=UPI0030B49328
MLKTFKKNYFIAILPVVFILFGSAETFAQNKTQVNTGTKNPLAYLSSAIDTFNRRLPSEKLFVHTDKSFYTIGDTLWFKSYLFNGRSSYSVKSGIVYLDLITDSAVVVKSISVPAVIGLSWGQIVLNEESFKEGFYTIRGYTNWMQNFGEEAFFTRRIYIASPAANHWLVNQSNTVTANAAERNFNYSLQFKKANGDIFGYKVLQWQLSDSRKNFAKNTYEALNKTLDARIDLNTTKGPLFMKVQEKAGDKQQLSFPLLMSPSPDIDLQFMPESGFLVAGLPCRVAFKALDIYGKGINLSGVLKNNRGESLTEFQSLHKGMGSFNLTPISGETYQAVVSWGDGMTKTVALPALKTSGSALQVGNIPTNDSLRLEVLFSIEHLDKQEYKLMGFSDGQPYFTAFFKADRQRIRMKVPKTDFPSGIAHFTLFNSENEPVNERVTFINHKDNLNIRITSAKDEYHLRDSVPLSIRVTDAKGKAVETSLSIAVTDDSQIKAELQQENIVTQTLFGAELKGNVEEPAWYFSDAEKTGEALDLLMLTQGWVGYNWKNILNPAIKPLYAAQPELQVSGRVSNVLNKPVVNAKMLLLTKGKFNLIRDTVTNADGRFIFKNFPAVDTVSFIVQSRNSKGRSFGIGLEMDVIKPAPFTLTPRSTDIPWFVSSDPSSLQLLSNKQKLRAEESSISGKNVLSEVVIAGKKNIPKSKNLNGPGEADQIIDEKEAQKAGTQSLIDFLQEHVKGFSLRSRDTDQFFYINEKKVRFVVDGVELNRFYMADDPPVLNQYYNFINDALTSLSADQILGVEVMYNLKNTSAYSSSFLTIEEQIGNAGRSMPAAKPGAPRPSIRDQFTSSSDIAYLEITTRSGQGIFFKKTPGIAVYRPLPLTWPKEFYRPKYSTSNTAKFSDLRSTLHWEANILTDAEGRGFTSFYSSDNAGTYTVILQGSNMGGLVGFSSFKIKVLK